MTQSISSSSTRRVSSAGCRAPRRRRRAARRRRSRRPRGRTPGGRRSCARPARPRRTGADDQRAARLHDGGDDPGARGPAGHRDDAEPGGQEEDRLHGREHRVAGQPEQRLRDEQPEDRGGQQRVQQRRDLVEGLRGDLARLALVEAVQREGAQERHDGRQRQRRERPARRDDGGRGDGLGDRVGDRAGRHQRERVGDQQRAHATAQQAAPTPADGEGGGRTDRRLRRLDGRRDGVRRRRAHRLRRARGRTRSGWPRCGWPRRACGRCSTGGTSPSAR